MLGANTMWGLMSPVAKMVFASGAVFPAVMIDFRIAGAALLFWIASLFLPREHMPIGDILRLVGAGMLGILLNQGAFIVGVSLTSPGEASLVTTTMPMWVMLLAWVILREPITARKAGGIVVGAAGAIILIVGSGSIGARGSQPAVGDLLVLCAQFSYALYLTLYRNFIRRYSLVTLMKWMFLSASAVGVPCSMKWIARTSWQSISACEWLGIIYVVICGTFLAYIGIMTGQKNLRPTVVGMYNYVQPVVATIGGVGLGLDKFTPVKAVAIVLIFSGVWLVTTSRARRA